MSLANCLPLSLIGLAACTGSSGEIKAGTTDPGDRETGSTELADSGSPEGGDTGDSAVGDTGDDDGWEGLWDPPEGYTCWTLYTDYSTGQYFAGTLDLESGLATPVVELPAEEYQVVTDSSSLGREGETLYTCRGGEELLVTISLVDGTVTYTDTPCWSAARWRGRSAHAGSVVLLAPTSDSLVGYPDLASATAGEPGDPLVGGASVHASRITISDDLVFAAWHSTDTVDVVALAMGTVMPSIVTEDRAGWVWGMAVVDDVLFIQSFSQIYAFDRATGDALGWKPLQGDDGGYWFAGLLCETEEELETY